jgi:hypothetical protein
MATVFLERLCLKHLERGFIQYWCIPLVTLEHVETCFDVPRPAREYPGPVKRKRRVLNPRFVTAQIGLSADCVHVTEHVSVHPGAVCVYIAVLHYAPKHFLYKLCGISRRPGKHDKTQRSRHPTAYSPLFPSSLYLHDSQSSFKLSSDVQVSNIKITTVPSSSVSGAAVIGESVQQRRSDLKMNAARQ